ncbi:hypothetical protein [Serratia fonticola]
MKKVAIVVIMASLTSVSANAGDALIKKISGTRAAICFNHPNKQVCIDGINALMKTAKAAAEVGQACKAVSELGGQDTDNCHDAEDAVKWIEEN